MSINSSTSGALPQQNTIEDLYRETAWYACHSIIFPSIPCCTLFRLLPAELQSPRSPARSHQYDVTCMAYSPAMAHSPLNSPAPPTPSSPLLHATGRPEASVDSVDGRDDRLLPCSTLLAADDEGDASSNSGLATPSSEEEGSVATADDDAVWIGPKNSSTTTLEKAGSPPFPLPPPTTTATTTPTPPPLQLPSSLAVSLTADAAPHAVRLYPCLPLLIPNLPRRAPISPLSAAALRQYFMRNLWAARFIECVPHGVVPKTSCTLLLSRCTARSKYLLAWHDATRLATVTQCDAPGHPPPQLRCCCPTAISLATSDLSSNAGSITPHRSNTRGLCL